MHFIIEPADPDCPKCNGTGSFSKYTGTAPNISFSISNCDCRNHANLAKIQARCDHEYVCEKCGKTHEE